MPELGERHICRIDVSNEHLLKMMQEGFEIDARTTKGIPDGAVFLGSHFDIETQTVSFFFSHPSFPLTVTGAAIPAIPWEITHDR